MNDILITGAGGQLGKAMVKVLDLHHENYDAKLSRELDITNRAAVMTYFEQNKPSIVYHCAAYTAVDKAEKVEKNRNYAVNVDGTKNIVDACKLYDTLLVFVSTDYVFSGERKSGEYSVQDRPHPINEYGKSKFEAEKIVIDLLDKYYIVRTSSVYGEGNNFVQTMLRLAETNDEIKVVSDQICRPTWANTLAEFMYYLVNHKESYGIYQCSDDGVCSWYEFATEILKHKDVKVIPIKTSEYPTVAKRPMYSVMELSKETGFKFPQWKYSLQKYMEKLSW